MDDILPSFDVDFEPQSRPRSGTWPLRRPNIDTKNKNNGAPTLSTTIEEPETIDNTDINEEYVDKDYDMFSGIINNANTFQTNLDNVLVGSPNVTHLSTLEERPSTVNGSNETMQTRTTVTELHTHKPNYDNNYIVNQQNRQLTNSIPQENVSSYSNACENSIPPVSSAASPTGANATTPKAKSSRKNAWGNMSYADLITQAIEASPDKRLTLAQIYEWMVKHIPYFKDKGDSNSSAGWKNSIRHNLSLHSKFKRIQNEGTGKSSWWVINHEAKPGKSPRRRAASMDTSSAKFKAQRSKAKQKAELKKQQKLGKGLTAGESPPWGRGINLETPVSKALSSEFRTRASSNASSVGGRLSPGMFIRDDETSLSPHSGSNGNINVISSPLPSAFGDIFDIPKQSSEHLDGQLVESMAKTSIVPNNYQNQIQDTPNLASLLRNNNSPPNQRNIKTEPQQANQGFSSCVVPYQISQNQNIQQMSYQSNQPPALSHQYPSYDMYNNQSASSNPMYSQQQVPPQQQLFGGMQATMNQYNQQQIPQNDQFRMKSEPGNFPDDIDVDRPFFDSSDVDISQILSDPNSLDIDFGNLGNNGIAFNMGMDGNILQDNSQQQNNSNIAGLQDHSMMYQQSQMPAQSQYSMQ